MSAASRKPAVVRSTTPLKDGLTASPTAFAAVCAPAVIAVAWLIIVAATQGAPKLPLAVKDGFSAFAVFYIAAQVIERVLEPFTGLAPTDPTIRMLYLWAAASVLGMVFSVTLGLGFLTTVVASGSVSPALDVLLTGVVIGGGSKSLHDLISSLQGPAAG